MYVVGTVPNTATHVFVVLEYYVHQLTNISVCVYAFCCSYVYTIASLAMLHDAEGERLSGRGDCMGGRDCRFHGQQLQGRGRRF